MAAEDADRVPDRAVVRIRHHGIGAGSARDAHVLGGVGRLARLGIVVALAVAVGVEHERRPALRFLRVAGFVAYFRVDPAGDRAGAADSHSVLSAS